MKLFTKEIDTKLFEQYLIGSDLENQMVVAKIFNPYGRGTWYLLNSDPEDPEYLWAIVDMDDIEVGSVNRSDLENIRIKPFMLGLERDLSFRQMNALELYEGLNEGKKYNKGGSVESENKEMVLNNNKQIAHHTKELQSAIKGKNVPAWVVAKVNRSASDLSDATHYMEGQGESYADGGGVDDKFTKGDKVTDGRGNVGIIKEVQVNGSLYIQWISYSGEPTSDLTADNNPENFEKMETGGGVGQPYDSMTKYQLDKEYKKLNEKRDILKKKYGKFDSTEIVENEKEIDKIITLLYGENFSGVGQKYKYAEGGGGVGDFKMVSFPEDKTYKYYVVDEDKYNYLTVQEDMFDKWKNANKLDKAEYYSEWIPKNEMVELMKTGGGISNQYEGKKAKEIYELWDYGQKFEFFKDHFKDKGVYSISEFKRLTSKKYDELDETSKNALVEHIKDGQYSIGGGVKYYNKENEYRLGRPSGSIEKEILDKVTFKNAISEQYFVGSFGWKTTQGKLGDGYLYNLDEFDQNLTKDLKLKSDEKVFRYVNRTTAIGGITPFIKINIEKALLYFPIYNDNEDILFETKGVKPLWINIIKDKMKTGGGVDNEMLSMDLKAIKLKYPNAKVGYSFAKDSRGKGYVITAKEIGKVVYTSYKAENGGKLTGWKHRKK
jgi:hypothetical protein